MDNIKAEFAKATAIEDQFWMKLDKEYKWIVDRIANGEQPLDAQDERDYAATIRLLACVARGEITRRRLLRLADDVE